MGWSLSVLLRTVGVDIPTTIVPIDTILFGLLDPPLTRKGTDHVVNLAADKGFDTETPIRIRVGRILWLEWSHVDQGIDTRMAITTAGIPDVYPIGKLCVKCFALDENHTHISEPHLWRHSLSGHGLALSVRPARVYGNSPRHF